jgi:hypothetical protein
MLLKKMNDLPKSANKRTNSFGQGAVFFLSLVFFSFIYCIFYPGLFFVLFILYFGLFLPPAGYPASRGTGFLFRQRRIFNPVGAGFPT